MCVCISGALGDQDKQLGFLCVKDSKGCPVHCTFLAYACHPGVIKIVLPLMLKSISVWKLSNMVTLPLNTLESKDGG